MSRKLSLWVALAIVMVLLLAMTGLYLGFAAFVRPSLRYHVTYHHGVSLAGNARGLFGTEYHYLHVAPPRGNHPASQVFVTINGIDHNLRHMTADEFTAAGGWVEAARTYGHLQGPAGDQLTVTFAGSRAGTAAIRAADHMPPGSGSFPISIDSRPPFTLPVRWEDVTLHCGPPDGTSAGIRN